MKAIAHLPGLDIEIVHHQSPDGLAEQISINLKAVPSFEAFVRFYEAMNPFAFGPKPPGSRGCPGSKPCAPQRFRKLRPSRPSAARSCHPLTQNCHRFVILPLASRAILAPLNSASAGLMTDVALTAGASPKPKLDHPIAPTTAILFVTILLAGILYAGLNIYLEVRDAGVIAESWLPFILLGIALLIALGFEFVNGFHDTANAVATVIYTHSLAPNVAVLWSGFWNFVGVMVSTGAVAFVIISLLPVELILQVGSHAGFAMVFALLFAAIIWNLGTWWLGLPASSSHTLIGSIIGVGIANALMQGRDGTAGVDWSQAANVGYALLLSPIIGFICVALLFLALRYLVPNPALYQEPKGATPPPLWIRAILILTCTGVSFAHGSNDGQKGMGLIMLILIGTVPTAYALNRATPASNNSIHSGPQRRLRYRRVRRARPRPTAAAQLRNLFAPGSCSRTRSPPLPSSLARSMLRSTNMARCAGSRPLPSITCATTCISSRRPSAS